MSNQYNKELINLLKTKEDIIPEKHDGSYVLIPEVIKLLENSKLENLNYKDLDAIYFLCIGDWKIPLDKRIEYVSNSNLEEEIKNKIKDLINREKINRYKYSNKKNGKDSYGLFGAATFTFKQYEQIITKDEILNFFKLIVEINDADNTDNILNILEEYKNLDIKGLKKGSLSQFFHCIKPNAFPILNSLGKDIYKQIGIEIDKDDSFNGYINDVKNINRFMKENSFHFKNYRVIDLLRLEELNMNEEISTSEIIDILKQKKQIILQGAPGTGKTYITAEIAVSLIDGNIPNDRKSLMNRYKELIDKNQIYFTTFHQSMDYEEFVEGFKPTANDDNIYYEVKDGIFKEACNSTKTAGEENGIKNVWDKFQNELNEKDIRYDSKNNNIGKITLKTKRGLDFYLNTDDNGYVRYKPASQEGNNWRYIRAALFGLYFNKYKSALSYTEPLLDYLKKNYNLSDPIENNDNPVVLIIDEINRGNISKIFGELITLLESDKRNGSENEIKVVLPYSKETFSVPNNLYIIGTMNTTDRSIGYIDYALRRRFAFITIKALKEKIENYYKDDELKEKAASLFDTIEEIISNNLNDEFDIDDIMIGHSYFMAKDIKELNTKLNYEIKPLLLEYLKDGILQNNNELKNTIKDLIIE